MTDHDIDRLVQGADPHAPANGRDLHSAANELLDEILDSGSSIAAPTRWRRRPAALALAAAAALVVAVSVPALRGDSDPRPIAGGQTVQVGDGSDTIVYTAAAIEVAKNNSRLLIDEPGWKATTVYGFAKDSGTINFQKGDREVEMNWYPADAYDTYYEDRDEVSDREPITIDGQQGSRVSYSDTDIAAMVEPEGKTFVEIRTNGGFKDTADVLATFAKVKHVDIDTWLAALPPEIVTPGKIDEVADEILADIPLPPGFDREKLAALGVNDRYQFGAETVSMVVCDWLQEWQRADRAGDTGAQTRAVAALAGARGWRILDEMQETGDYSPGVWDLADRVEVGGDPRRFQESLGCVPESGAP